MADDKVQIQFAAKLDELSEGLSQVQNQVSASVNEIISAVGRMNSESTHATHSIAQQFGHAFKEVTEIIEKVQMAMIAFSSALAGGFAFKEAIEGAIKWTEENHALQLVMGGTTEEASVLNMALKEIGMSSEAYTGMVMKLDRQLKNAPENLEKLGIKIKDSNGQLLDQKTVMQNAIHTMAEYEEGTNRNQFALFAFGRGAKEALDLHRLTTEQMEHAKTVVEALGLATGEEGVRQMHAYEQATADMKAALVAVEMQIANAVLPTIITVTKQTNVWKVAVEALSASLKWLGTFLILISTELKIVGENISLGLKPLGVFVEAVAQAIRGNYSQAWETIKTGFRDTMDAAGQWKNNIVGHATEAASAIKSMWSPEAKKEEHGEEGNKGTKKMPDMSPAAPPENIVSKWQELLDRIKMEQDDFFTDSRQMEADYWRQKLDFLNEDSKEWLDVRKKVYEAEKGLAVDGLKEELIRLKTIEEDTRLSWDERLRAADQATNKILEKYHADSKEYAAALKAKEKLQREFEKEMTKIAMERIEIEKKLKDISIGMEKDKINYLKEAYAISDADSIRMFIETENKKYEELMSSISKQLMVDKITAEQKRNLLAQGEVAYAEHLKTIAKLNQQAALESMKPWRTMFDSISSAFSASIKGMITGTMTFRQAMINIAQAVVNAFLDMGLKIVMEWVKNMIFKAAMTKATAADEIATAGAVAVAKEAIGIAGNTALALSEAAVGTVAAGASVAAIPFVGWSMVPAVMAETGALLYGMAAMASAAGGYDIPAGVNPIVQTHAEEMILPAELANKVRGLTDGEGGRGGAFTFKGLDPKRLYSGRDFIKTLDRLHRDGHLRVRYA